MISLAAPRAGRSLRHSLLSKFQRWQKELIYTSSLTDRIKANIDHLK